MSARTAVIAALEREVAPLVRGWEHHEPARKVQVWRRGAVVVACAGMGAARVALAVQAALAAGSAGEPVGRLISAGVAGACDAALRAGDVLHASVVVDARTGERFETQEPGGVLVTAERVAGVLEKQRLHASYAASAVDMEAATVARLARAHGLGFAAIKAISDPVAFELEALNGFATKDGQFRTAAFVGYVAVRPALWGRLGLLARNGNAAIAALTVELQAALER